MKISSIKNDKVKYLRSLYRKKYRREHKQFVLEGVKLVEEALKEKKIYQLFYSNYLLRNEEGKELLAECQDLGIETYQLTDELLQEVADTESPQGGLAIVEQEEYKLEDIFGKDNELVVIADQVQDPGNLGTIIRTADAAGAGGVITTKGTVSFYNQKTIRATMGSLLRLPIYRVAKLERLTKIIKEKKIQVVAGDVEADKYHFEVDFTPATALLLGSEAHGIRGELLDKADEIVKIPLRGGAESLNVAMAASVILYEAVRQRLD